MNNIPPNHDGHGPDLEKANNNHVGNSCSISLDENEVRKKVRFSMIFRSQTVHSFFLSVANVFGHCLFHCLWNFDGFLRLTPFKFGRTS